MRYNRQHLLRCLLISLSWYALEMFFLYRQVDLPRFVIFVAKPAAFGILTTIAVQQDIAKNLLWALLCFLVFAGLSISIITQEPDWHVGAGFFFLYLGLLLPAYLTAVACTSLALRHRATSQK